MLNASVPIGVGTLNQISGAVPAIEFVEETILYTLINTVAAVLLVNWSGAVKERQFRNVDEKFTTFTLLSNKSDGYDDNDWQLLKQDEKFVADTLLSNNPDGIDVIVVNEKLSLNVVADVE